MFRLILQTQARLGGFSVPSHLLSPKVKSTLLNTNELLSAFQPRLKLELYGMINFLHTDHFQQVDGDVDRHRNYHVAS